MFRSNFGSAKLILSVDIHLDQMLHVSSGRFDDGTPYANVELPRSIQVQRAYGELPDVGVPITDPDLLRHARRRNRYRLVRHQRIKRDILNLFQQLRTKFGPAWTVVEAYMGTVFFVGNKVMK